MSLKYEKIINKLLKSWFVWKYDKKKLKKRTRRGEFFLVPNSRYTKKKCSSWLESNLKKKSLNYWKKWKTNV